MELFNLLYRSIISDTEKRPERLNATLERIQEVANIVLGDRAPVLQSLLTEVYYPNQDPRDPVNEEKAQIIVRNLVTKFGHDKINQMALLLEDAEISADEAIELHEEFKIPVSHLEKDIIPVHGDGAWFRAIDGKTYLDMDSNYSATNLGLSNREIAQGLFNQASQLISMKEDRVHIARARFLKTFRGMLPEELSQFYWQNSGGEAVDKSLKFAKAYTQTTGVVAFKDGFHGRTHGALAVTYNPKYRKPFGLDQVDWVHFVEYNDADAVEKLFAERKAKIVILELIQSEEAGIRPADPEFILKLRWICDQYKGVMICDEIQTGFGRVTEKEGQWFACQAYGVLPDIIAIGKSFGGGYPVTAVVTNRKISQMMQPGYDGSTFGGNPMAMVAATIATRQMRTLNLTKNVALRSVQLFEGLYKLQEKFPILGEIRGKGLMVGIDLPSVESVTRFQQQMAANGVKTSLSTDHTVRYLPPLVISKSDVDFLLEAMDNALKVILEENYKIKV
jgi:acetylornithine/succinyldiaminopimelate/putrescine aminotransferase